VKSDLSHIDDWKLQGGEDGGVWAFNPFGVRIIVIASWGGGWDHVSASTSRRVPSYEELCAIKELFFDDDETVMQLHVPSVQHVNNHPYCLHLWKPQNYMIPVPPAEFVGYRALNVEGGR
jgi:hypothetical protein